ncbi:uncharacterized protein LOC127728242 [Mytilus californianus]|uniref:uncharacterized protein LOC127728242 n=1 Tax=Mytilus californianus TaxID=6549 RepID=UPI002246F064|nr:uncharacterized protein LOC127728242 [Mytilus californianus]
MSDENVCSVCYDTFKFPKMLPCKHSFCISCLHEFLGGLQDQSNLICPLCREPCYVPEKGFTDFPTNNFVPVEKPPKVCQECHKLPVYQNCFLCSTVLCKKCNRMHSHTKHATERIRGDDSDDENIVSLPPHLHWHLMHQNMKTEFLCKQNSMFVGEFLPIEEIRKTVRSMAFSRNGGVFVRLDKNEFLLKYDKHGKIMDRIPLPAEASTVLEIKNGCILLAHIGAKVVGCYNPPKFQVFARTPTFHPIGLAELQNENIAVSGPTHLCNAECKDGDCELSNSSPGVLHIYTTQGKLLQEISKDAMEYIFKCPTQMASSYKAGTIAVCDTKFHKVIVLDYDGKVRGLYKGWRKLPFSLFTDGEPFLPLSVCTTADGNFIVADIYKECLHVLSPLGKFIGIMRGEEGDSLIESSALCVDSEQNIWVGHHSQGTITVLKPSRLNNIFDQRHFPFLHGEELRLPLFPELNLDGN